MLYTDVLTGVIRVFRYLIDPLGFSGLFLFLFLLIASAVIVREMMRIVHVLLLAISVCNAGGGKNHVVVSLDQLRKVSPLNSSKSSPSKKSRYIFVVAFIQSVNIRP